MFLKVCRENDFLSSKLQNSEDSFNLLYGKADFFDEKQSLCRLCCAFTNALGSMFCNIFIHLALLFCCKFCAIAKKKVSNYCLF